VTALQGKVSLLLMGTPPIQMANLGMADSLILMVMALVVFGPRRLPQIGRQIGKLMYEFRKASNDFKFQMEEELRSAEEADRRKKDEERMKALAVTASAPKLSTTEAVAPLVPPTMLEATDPPATIESPYPNEGDYPPAIPDYSEPPAEETVPRIQPPSTGEQVAAARPNSLTALAMAAKQQSAAASTEDSASPEPLQALAEVAVVLTIDPEKSEDQPKSEAERAANHA
jgi:sec-independent protein translocase protein TatB